MDLIEKAAERLAQLQRAGVDVPAAQVPGSPAAGASIPTPERLAQALERSQAPERGQSVEAHATLAAPAVGVSTLPAPIARATGTPAPRSKVVQIDLDALAAAGFVTP